MNCPICDVAVVMSSFDSFDIDFLRCERCGLICSEKCLPGIKESNNLEDKAYSFFTWLEFVEFQEKIKIYLYAKKNNKEKDDA